MEQGQEAPSGRKKKAAPALINTLKDVHKDRLRQKMMEALNEDMGEVQGLEDINQLKLNPDGSTAIPKSFKASELQLKKRRGAAIEIEKDVEEGRETVSAPNSELDIFGHASQIQFIQQINDMGSA